MARAIPNIMDVNEDAVSAAYRATRARRIIQRTHSSSGHSRHGGRRRARSANGPRRPGTSREVTFSTKMDATNCSTSPAERVGPGARLTYTLPIGCFAHRSRSGLRSPRSPGSSCGWQHTRSRRQSADESVSGRGSGHRGTTLARRRCNSTGRNRLRRIPEAELARVCKAAIFRLQRGLQLEKYTQLVEDIPCVRKQALRLEKDHATTQRLREPPTNPPDASRSNVQRAQNPDAM